MSHRSSPGFDRLLSHLLPRANVCLVALTTTACASQSSEVRESGTGIRPIAIGALAGTSGPATIDVQNDPSATAFAVPARVLLVWGTLPAVFDQIGIEPTFVDAGQARIGNPRYTRSRIERRSLSTYVDCGSGLTGPNADSYDVTLSVLVFLTAASRETTTVHTTLDAYASARSTNGTSIHCTSKGVLERRIVALVQERLTA